MSVIGRLRGLGGGTRESSGRLHYSIRPNRSGSETRETAAWFEPPFRPAAAWPTTAAAAASAPAN